MNIDVLSFDSVHPLSESATGAIAPLQGACSLASEHRFAGVAHAPRNPCFTFSGPLASLFLLVECSPRRRHPCRARLRLQAQTVSQADRMRSFAGRQHVV